MKRKHCSSSELKTNPINIQLMKYSMKYNSLCNIIKLQPFFPPIECLFKTENLDRILEYGIKFPWQIQSINDLNILKTSLGQEYQIHPKITMLLNPYKYMKGELQSIELPLLNNDAKKIQNKLQNFNNAAYVGSILSSVFALSECQHFPKVFGVFSGISNEFVLDISDDYEELSERPWFSKNMGKTFSLKLKDGHSTKIEYTRTARLPLSLKDDDQDIILEDVQVLEGISSENEIKSEEFKTIYEETLENDNSDSSSSISTSYIFAIESIDTFSDDEIDEESEDEDENDEPFAWATFKNVPVQLTIMEKLQGTLYDLFTLDKNPEKHYVWLIQVIFALAYAQRNFGFVHNDLHGNNIMYQSTTKEFLYYMHNSITYKIPTYGYILKIIDFDRGIGYVKLPGMKEPRLFMSDQFAAEDEAGGQYNFEPFYKEKYPVIKPNPSFDLVRLATSLFWDLFPMGPKYDDYQSQKLFKMFMRWLTLPDNTSILFHKQNPKLDRYFGFDLYKAIARYSKDTAIPRKEIVLLNEFITNELIQGEIPLIIDV